MRGGSGQSGRYRHKRSSLIRSGEFANMHYAGKKGFFPVSASRDPVRTINLFQLSNLVERLVAEKKAQSVGEKVVVDLEELGFGKLLGTGSISRPVQVKVEKCSEGAAKKLKDAGGELLNPPPAAAPAK